MKRKIYREDILNAGLQLMFENGYNATGIKEITDRIKIPKGSFYNHFSSKEEFGLEVVQMYCDNGAKMYEARFLNKDIPPIQRVEGFFDALIASYGGQMNYKLGCVMGNFSTEMSDVNENFRMLLDDEFNRLEAIIAECLTEAQKDNTLKEGVDPQQTAAFILNSWHGAMLRMKSTANSKPLKDCKEIIMSIIKT